MPTDQPVFARADTLLGVCEALGQDLGFAPLLLRVALGATVLWDPMASIAVYAMLGLAGAISRFVYPARALVPSMAAVAGACTGDNDEAQLSLPIAA